MVSLRQKKNKKGKRMAKIGDRVTITIHGPTMVSGTASTATTNTVLGSGQLISASGKIVDDLGDNWMVEFDYPLLGTKRMVVLKSRIV